MGVVTFGELVGEVESGATGDVLLRLRELEARRRRDAAEEAVLLASLEQRKAYRPDGHASMYGLLRSALGWSEAECRQRTQIARLVEAYRCVGEVLFEAQASLANIAAIARLFANPRCGDGIDGVLGNMLTEAGRREHRDFVIIPERWQLLNDPGRRAEHAAIDEARDARFALVDGKGRLVCEWGSADAAHNREVFDKFLEAEFEADWAWTVASYGDQASTSLLPRTAAQRAADAVTAIFRKAAAIPPGSKAPQPVTALHLDWHTFRDLLTEAGLFPERLVDPFDDPTPLVSKLRCETGDGVLIDPDRVLQELLDGHVRFVIHDDRGIPIHWGRERRLFTGAAREAVMSLHPRCTHPGCVTRTGRSQADHLTPWSAGGETRPDNGGPRCARHNRLRNHGYTVHRDRQGNWHTYRPDGTEIR